MYWDSSAIATEDRIKKANVCLGLAADTHRTGEAKWPLPNLTPSGESEFWGWMSSYGHYFMRASLRALQIPDKTGKLRWANVHVYFVDVHNMSSGGFAVACFYSEYVGKHPDGKYEHEVQYFTWNKCVHDFKSSNVGRCLTRYSCAKCGDYHEIDSSG